MIIIAVTTRNPAQESNIIANVLSFFFTSSSTIISSSFSTIKNISLISENIIIFSSSSYSVKKKENELYLENSSKLISQIKSAFLFSLILNLQLAL